MPAEFLELRSSIGFPVLESKLSSAGSLSDMFTSSHGLQVRSFQVYIVLRQRFFQ